MRQGHIGSNLGLGGLVEGSTLVISFTLGWPSMARPASSRRGRRGGEMAGLELGAPGCRPRVQLKPTVPRPSQVERLSEALLPRAQTERNSDATMNWELGLEVKKSRSQDYFQLLTGC